MGGDGTLCEGLGAHPWWGGRTHPLQRAGGSPTALQHWPKPSPTRSRVPLSPPGICVESHPTQGTSDPHPHQTGSG